MRLGTCRGCGSNEVWVNIAVWFPLGHPGEYCAACYERLKIPQYSSKMEPFNTSSGKWDGGEDPGWHNVVRSLDEDR
jgi:hypothetical protein